MLLLPSGWLVWDWRRLASWVRLIKILMASQSDANGFNGRVGARLEESGVSGGGVWGVEGVGDGSAQN